MSTYALAFGPGRRVARGVRGVRGGRGGLHTLLQVLRDLGEIVAFSYRLRTAGNGVGRPRSAAR